jgi:hypothetical protein
LFVGLAFSIDNIHFQVGSVLLFSGCSTSLVHGFSAILWK